MRLVVAAAIATLLATPAAPAHASTEAHVDDLVVGGAHGLIGVPAGEPDTLVVILHGYNHEAESHRGHLQHLADQGYLALAMDYTGEGFPLRAGADDTLAALAWALDAHDGIDRVVLYSISMGTAVASLVLSETDVFDQWVVAEGLSMLHETWAGATLLTPSGNPTAIKAKADIEAECDGTPAQQPLCYRERSAALNVALFGELDGVVLAHGVNDGLVPYNHGREMVGALRAVGIPSDFYTALRSGPGGEGTNLTGYAGLGGMGLAGHGTESNDGHMLTALSFALLDDVLAGRLVPADREHVRDHGSGTAP